MIVELNGMPLDVEGHVPKMCNLQVFQGLQMVDHHLQQLVNQLHLKNAEEQELSSLIQALRLQLQDLGQQLLQINHDWHKWYLMRAMLVSQLHQIVEMDVDLQQWMNQQASYILPQLTRASWYQMMMQLRDDQQWLQRLETQWDTIPGKIHDRFELKMLSLFGVLFVWVLFLTYMIKVHDSNANLWYAGRCLLLSGSMTMIISVHCIIQRVKSKVQWRQQMKTFD